MLFDATLQEGRPPMTGPPSEEDPQPVALWPGWVWWRGVAGLLYARRPKTSPPMVVRAHNFTALLSAIRKAEARRNGVHPAVD
jgi:hypothetical protein